MGGTESIPSPCIGYVPPFLPSHGLKQSQCLSLTMSTLYTGQLERLSTLFASYNALSMINNRVKFK